MELLLTIILVIALIGILFRLFAPFLLKLLVKRLNKRFNQQGGSYNQQNSRRQRREGEVTIENNKSQEKVVDKNFGDYVDFEEEK